MAGAPSTAGAMTAGGSPKITILSSSAAPVAWSIATDSTYSPLATCTYLRYPSASSTARPISPHGSSRVQSLVGLPPASTYRTSPSWRQCASQQSPDRHSDPAMHVRQRAPSMQTKPGQ